MQWYELSTDPPGTGMCSYRDREKWAISEHESTLDSRSRQARLTGGMNEGGGGGRRISAMAAMLHRVGLPTDKTASGRAKGETACKH
eukprot:5897615-Pyramimonas_sp.AAC.1